MYNYVITRISCQAIGRYCFVTGAVLGGAGGMLLGMMERQLISILGGMFLGLLAALAFAAVGLAFTAAFNLLAPITGGIAVELKPMETLPAPQAFTDSAAQQQSLFPGE